MWKVPGNRQKWQFIKVGKDWYNIILTGGMVNRGDLRLGNSYLSTTSKGDRVDLWNQDDGSGRQRWKVKN